ncbi:hypothetical protein [Kineococcus rubinsiae]|uniref:hypothetical protein n=1 Tax=Kineococcus rubinsiae TaxID=2609562 RepID=UPI0014311880|nr:hypothetical protein [Kineococcus rubinsiae]NIZ92835.1 hypothetical protein [Kineococcus rubinsiae]
MSPRAAAESDAEPDAALDEVAEELYGLAPEEFTAARDRRAKEARTAGDRDLATSVRALRRPSTAAWAVNQLVRRHPDVVDQLGALGSRLREAQLSLAGAELRALTTEQQKVTATVRALAEQDAAADGAPLSSSVGDQVVQTLRAALADEDAATAVRSGRLTTHLEHTGFGPVDLDGAVAVPRVRRPAPASAPAAAPEPDEGRAAREAAEREREEQRQAARREIDAAGQAAADAADALRDAESRAGDAAGAEEEAAGRVRDLEHRLQEARRERDAAAAAQRTTTADRDAAARAAREADAALQRARHRLDTLS